MKVTIDYEEAFQALYEELKDDEETIRCQDCDSPRLDWYKDGDFLVADCEDCTWKTKQRFDGVRYQ